MLRVIPILSGAAFTVAFCEAAGLVLLRRLKITLDPIEEGVFAFVTGAAVVSFGVFLLCVIHQARLPVFLALAGLCGAAVRPSQSKISCKPVKAVYLLYFLPFGAAVLVCFFNAVAPEVSPDGSGYHLGNVVRISQNHGFVWDYHSMYSHFPQGMEMLFLVAYSIGGLSAAAVVQLTFLCALAVLLVCYGRRFGFPHAGIFAALLVCASPVVELTGSSAYNDVALATCTYAVFYLLQVWHEGKDANVLLIIGLLAGFAFALKYTGWLVLPFAMVVLRGRGLLRVLPAAAVIALPWIVRNWIWLGNPFAPFVNSWFPNPFYSADLEIGYLRSLRQIDGFSHWWQVPLDMTLYGARLPGFLGPVFLLAPLALLALRHRQGRQLLAAATIFSVPVLLNPGARFLVAGLPFLALAMGLALQHSPGVLPALSVFHVLLSIPAAMPIYCADWAWRIRTVPVRVALGLDPEGPYIQRYIPDYWLKEVIDRNVPKQQTIFSLATRPEAYLDRRIVVGYESSLGDRASQAVWSKNIADLKPMRIGFLLLNDTDPGAVDIQYHANSFGLTLIEKRNGTSFYRLE